MAALLVEPVGKLSENRPRSRSSQPHDIDIGDAISEVHLALGEFKSNADAIEAAFAAGDCGKLKKLLPPKVRGALADKRDDIIEIAKRLLLDSQTGDDT